MTQDFRGLPSKITPANENTRNKLAFLNGLQEWVPHMAGCMCWCPLLWGLAGSPGLFQKHTSNSRPCIGWWWTWMIVDWSPTFLKIKVPKCFFFCSYGSRRSLSRTYIQNCVLQYELLQSAYAFQNVSQSPIELKELGAIKLVCVVEAQQWLNPNLEA